MSSPFPLTSLITLGYLFLILLSTSGVIYLFYTTKDFPQFFKNSLFFEPIKTYSIKVIEKLLILFKVIF